MARKVVPDLDFSAFLMGPRRRRVMTIRYQNEGGSLAGIELVLQ